MPVALITGVTGQDGTYLARDLLEQGFEVHGLVKPGDATLGDRSPGVVGHEGDVTDSALLAQLIAKVKPDEVYNLAGQTSVAASWADPVGTAASTGTAVAIMAQGCWELQERTGRPVRFVQASSAEIFGAAAQVPQNESTTISPVSPYGAAKSFGHFIVGAFRSRGLHASSCILYNHESPLRPPTFVTRKITLAAARISLGLQDSLSLGTLDVSRDWGWAPDYVRAMQLAARHSVAGDFVIGSGVEHTVADFVASAFTAAGIDAWQDYVVLDPTFARPADPPRQLADSSRARSVLGWVPQVGFDDLVRRMVMADLGLLGADSTN
ncbi:GDP-mannose 4,6-dehydratase [Salinibacterium xinjiangense]|uniref:GDP-mannose 4,6-dehydratase n=1 Tax=Salinibacterium xinjiangense TaxID=386302 RepID=A0A2C8Y6R4_9MICO|nr:GDP-mannose 4,6-dehydratase [Salinibacterium xinjiangense]GGK95442.1 GDP-mannose 4,6-dehydratase [Salinibacterium xinjiangense]SOE45853.1 GDPmannose 4,6-dehydratase [Salinibacterium xinjiangense]